MGGAQTVIRLAVTAPRANTRPTRKDPDRGGDLKRSKRSRPVKRSEKKDPDRRSALRAPRSKPRSLGPSREHPRDAAMRRQAWPGGARAMSLFTAHSGRIERMKAKNTCASPKQMATGDQTRARRIHRWVHCWHRPIRVSRRRHRHERESRSSTGRTTRRCPPSEDSERAR